MTLDSGWALIISTLIGVVLVWVGNLVGKHFGNNEATADEAHQKIEDIYRLITNLRTDFLEYQRHIAENYAKTAQVERMETGILSALQRLEQKIDRIQERDQT